GDKAPAADFAARFEAPQHAQQFAPWRKPCRLAFEQPPEHHAIAAQQGAGDVLDHALLDFARATRRTRGYGTAQQRPASRVLDSEPRGGPAALAAGEGLASLRGREQRTQA